MKSDAVMSVMTRSHRTVMTRSHKAVMTQLGRAFMRVTMDIAIMIIL